MENIVTREGVETESAAASLPAERERAETGVRDQTVLLIVGALLVGFSFWWTQFSTRSICCGDFDGYYHFGWARMLQEGLRAGDFPPAFEALPLTTLNSADYVDHHFLFHLLQIPFTWFDDASAAAWGLLVVLLLASPLVYRRALRLIREGNTNFVAGLTSTLAGLVVVMALIQTRGGALWKLAASALIVATIGLCGWLTTRLLSKGQARPVAALAAFALALLAPMVFFRATTFYQAQAPDFFGGDPYGNFQYGAKLGTWLFACLAVMACYWMVLRYRLRYPVVWLLALLGCSTPFLYRMNMGKAMSVSIVLLVVGIHLLFRRKYLWLLPLSYVFALTYDMVLLLWVAAGVWLAVNVWAEDWEVTSRPVVWAAGALLLVVAGTALGFVINPYFPRNVQLVYEHMAMKITAKDFSTAVGGEWYPYNTWEFLWNCFVACVSMIVGYVAFRGDGDRREVARALFFLLFATFLMFVNARWKRFSEYWPPFAVLFVAFALQPYLARWASEVQGEAPAGRYDRWLKYAMGAVALAIMAVPAVWAAQITARDIKSNDPNQQYLGGMEWVKQNVPRGEMIFNTDWDDFPKLFFYSPEHRYASGLDPTYLLDRDKELGELYARIGLGEETNPGPPVRERFGARYVFTDKNHGAFMQNALDSGWFVKEYEDDNSIILRVLDASVRDEGGDEGDR
jgi:hypothetical protein